MTAISSTLSAFQGPAYIAATTLLIPKQHLGRASGMIQLGRAMGAACGACTRGFAADQHPVAGRHPARSGQFSLRPDHPAERALSQGQVAGKAERSSLLHEIAYGWGYVVSHPGILALILFFAAVNLLGGILEVLVTPLVLSFASTVALGTILSTG